MQVRRQDPRGLQRLAQLPGRGGTRSLLHPWRRLTPGPPREPHTSSPPTETAEAAAEAQPSWPCTHAYWPVTGHSDSSLDPQASQNLPETSCVLRTFSDQLLFPLYGGSTSSQKPSWVPSGEGEPHTHHHPQPCNPIAYQQPQPCPGHPYLSQPGGAWYRARIAGGEAPHPTPPRDSLCLPVRWVGWQGLRPVLSCPPLSTRAAQTLGLPPSAPGKPQGLTCLLQSQDWVRGQGTPMSPSTCTICYPNSHPSTPSCSERPRNPRT